MGSRQEGEAVGQGTGGYKQGRGRIHVVQVEAEGRLKGENVGGGGNEFKTAL